MGSDEREIRKRDIFSRIPVEVIVLIAQHADIVSIFSLKQTCRSAYELFDFDYLWHRVFPREELPLDVSPYTDIRSLSALDIQRSAMRALKLRTNWSKDSPQVCHINVANAKSIDGIFDELKLLSGANILLGVRHDRHSSRPSTTVCVYSLLNIRNPHLVAHLSIPAIMNHYDACTDNSDTTLIFSATITKDVGEILEVYSVHLPIDSQIVCKSAYDTVYSFVLPREGLFHKVSLHGSYVASSIMNVLLEEGGQSSQIMLVNWKTGEQAIVNPRFDDNIVQLGVRLLESCLAVTLASVSKARLEVFPLGIVRDHHHLIEHPQDHIDVPLMDFYDICISDNLNTGPHAPPPSLSLIVFPTISRLDMRQSKKAMHYRFSISVPQEKGATSAATDGGNDDAKRSNFNGPSVRLESASTFDIPVGSYPEHAQFGTSGRRAVWLEQSLRSDYVQLLRLDYNPLCQYAPSVSVLLPPQPQVPFKPSSCHSLAFDEVTGRLCVGMYNGPVYIVDYV